MSPPSGPVRLGVVSYLNSEPLVWGLEGDGAFTVRRDVPSRVAEMLHAGEVDLGLIPSVEYAFGDYAIVPGVALASRGAVRSVSLFHQGPLEEVRRVALDTSSRTSIALTRILLRERLGRDPEYLEMGPSLPAMLEVTDAALLIGDPALYFEGDLKRLDLGEEWTRGTGLPFVYAFWAGPPGAIDAAGVARLQAVQAAGKEAIAAIASRYNARVALNESYLRSNMVYDLGPGELAGLEAFYRRAHELGIIPRIPELRFHGHP